MVPQPRTPVRKAHTHTHTHTIMQHATITLRMRNQQIIFTPAYLNPPVPITATLVMANAVLKQAKCAYVKGA